MANIEKRTAQDGKTSYRVKVRLEGYPIQSAVGLLRADSGFFEDAFLAALEAKAIAYIIAARLTPPLQRALYQATDWWAVAPGLELTEITSQAHTWSRARRLVVVRQSSARQDAPGKNLVRRRSGYPGLALRCLRHHAGSADGRGLADLPGAGRL